MGRKLSPILRGELMKQIEDHQIAGTIFDDYMKADPNEKRVIKKLLDKALFELGSVADAITLMEEGKKK